MNEIMKYLYTLQNVTKKPVSLKAAEIFFKQREYAWAIQEIKNIMQIPHKIKVVSKKDLNKPAHVLVPLIFIEGKSKLLDHVFIIEISNSITLDFDVFVTTISHELSHIYLYYHNYKDIKHIEKAVDVTAMALGFSANFVRARRNHSNLFPGLALRYGYLSDKEIEFVHDSIIKERKFKPKEKKSGSEQKKKGFFNLIRELFQ